MTDGRDGDSTRAANRRKACDLCFTKKIKCDMLKPICSNCILYHADCKTSIVRKKPPPLKAKAAAQQAAAAASESTDGEVEKVEDRLARIEKQLQLILDQSQADHVRITGSTNSESSSEVAAPEYPEITSAGPSWSFDVLQPTLYNGPGLGADGLPMPSQEEILPLIDHYFDTLNRVIPIFHQETFMRQLNAWYNTEAPRERAMWAAIQMVIAMALRTPVPGVDYTIDLPARTKWADNCMRNAQSVVSDLVTRDEDLIGLQVLLALVLLFQNSSDQRPSAVLISTAVRLAHRLQLHSNTSLVQYPEDQQQQRIRVFWITYTFDKDISLRARTPSMQIDADIDIPLPRMTSSDGYGLLWSKDGSSSFNHFRMRLDLAHIQGKIYDLLYSNRALRICPVERRSRVEDLRTMLNKWYDRVPELFRIEHVKPAVGELELISMVKVHHAYLLSNIATNGIWSRDAEWVKRVSSVSRAAILDFATAIDRSGSKACTDHQEPPLKEGWTTCVEISRGCMKLFNEATPTDCLIWQCSCAYFSALIIILANILLSPTHDHISLDQHLVGRGIQLMDRFLEVVAVDLFRSLRRIVSDLSASASAAIIAAEADKQRQDSEPEFFAIHSEGVPDVEVFGSGLSFDDYRGQDGHVLLRGYEDPAIPPSVFDAFLAGEDPITAMWSTPGQDAENPDLLL